MLAVKQALLLTEAAYAIQQLYTTGVQGKAILAVPWRKMNHTLRMLYAELWVVVQSGV